MREGAQLTLMRERIERGDAPLWGAFLGSGSPLMAEMLSRAGFDWLVIDMQHSPLNSSSELLSMVQAISLGQSAPFLRAPWKTQYGAIMAALDAGVEGVIVPMLETAEEAEEVSKCFRYPPRGSRSWWPWRMAMADPGYSPEVGDRRAICLVQIETRPAIENLDAILEVAEVDGAYIGPRICPYLTRAASAGGRRTPFSTAYASGCSRHAAATGRSPWLTPRTQTMLYIGRAQASSSST